MKRGLGDIVAAVAQPIARAIDRAAGTDLAHCPSCARRRAALNQKGWRSAPPPPPARDTAADPPHTLR